MENSSNTVSDSILEKIQKLMALRDKPSCPEEADAAAARISALLMKYNISMMQVENHKVSDSSVEVLKGSYDEFQTPYDGDFSKQLLATVSHFNFCKLINHPSRDPMSKGGFTLLGKKHNVEIANYMFIYCVNNIKIFFDEYWKMQINKDRKNMHKRAFFQGATVSLTVRLNRQKKEAEQEYGKDTILAVMKLNDTAVQKKTDELFPPEKLRVGRQMKECQNRQAMAQGFKAGEKLNLSKGLDNDSNDNQK